MSDTRPAPDLADERLPWLASPRPTAPRAKPRPGPRARAPIFALLSLFFLAGIGLIAFLAGRGSVPSTRAERPLVEANPKSATMNLPPIAPSLPVEPAPSAAPEPTAKSPARPQVAEPKPKRAARAAEPRIASRIAPRARIAAAKIAEAARRRTAQRPLAVRQVWVSPPAPARPGRVIQLGTYTDPRQAEAAWRRLVGVYPYLGKLPKAVMPARGLEGQPVYYRLQLGARTKSDARRLCRNLLSIGRGCRVV